MKKVLLLFILLLFIYYISSAQSIDSIQHINEVTVIGYNSTSKIIPAQTLEGTQLQKLNVHSVADAIRYFSGVQIKDYGGIGGLKTVNIRSMGSQHVGVFYDGIELGNAQNGVVDLGKFSLDNMESVSLYNGQKSEIFQPAKDFASAGSIYMQTRIPSFANATKNNFRATIKTGSFGIVNPSFLWENKISENISSSINIEYMYTSGRYKFSYTKKDGYDTTEIRKNGDVYALRAEAALFGKINNGEWRAKAYYYDSERGYPGASVREEPGKFKNQDRQWDNNFFTQILLRKKISSFYNILLNGKYANEYLHYLSDPRADFSTMYVNNHYTQQEIYISNANGFTFFDWWSANVSIDFQRNSLDADLVGFVYPKRYTLLEAIATSLRFKTLSLQGSLLYTHVKEDTNREGTEAPEKNEWTPTVIASYKPFKTIDLNFRAFYKKIFRMPTLNDLYYTFIGNKDLNPEYTVQFNIGAGYQKKFSNSLLKNLDIQIDAYYNQVDDKIIAMPTSNQFRWTMVNLGYVEIKGVDVAVQGNWLFKEINLNTRLSYTYQKAQDFTDRQSHYYGGQIPYIPWHSGSVVIGTAYKKWDFNYSFIYTGERYESQANIPENYALPWYTHDMSVSDNLYFRKIKLRLTAEVNNLFNQQYEVVQCYPMPGINVKFILSIIL